MAGPPTGTNPGSGTPGGSPSSGGETPASGGPLGLTAAEAPPILLLLGLVALLVLLGAVRRRFLGPKPEAREPVPESATATPGDNAVFERPRAAPPDEEHVPRWRRPSVTAERFAKPDPRAAAATVAAMAAPARTRRVFSEAVDEFVERMVVRYDAVVLLDRPDDALGRSLVELNAGDEVAVLDRDDAWANVTTPIGLAGWVRTTALEAAEPTSGVSTGDGPTRGEPSLDELLAHAPTRSRWGRRRKAQPTAEPTET